MTNESYRSPRRRALLSPVLLLFVIALFASFAHASIGDRSPAFQRCLSLCHSSRCLRESPSPYSPSPALRLFRWSCLDDCKYTCMHNLSALALSQDISTSDLSQVEGLPLGKVVQYYGKWPFYRFLGIQEPLSVLFSFLNLYMHFKHGLLRLGGGAPLLASPVARRKRSYLPAELPEVLRWAYGTLLPVLGINLWICSMVFHTRDKPWTEKMDYFSSAAWMVANVWVAIVRIAGLYPSSSPSTRSSAILSGSSASGADKGQKARRALAVALGGIFLAHISYLTFWRFDYGYNMLFSVLLGLTHNLLWASFTLYHLFLTPSHLRPPHYLLPTLVLTLFTSLTALELLDFPPVLYKSLDAHALWHASTVMIVKWWYGFLEQDARYIAGNLAPQGEGGGKAGRIA